jgi:biopolymer transport protein TolR
MEISAQEVKADMNVTPLVDVVLVLLIIFMVVTPMITSHNVRIPETSNPNKRNRSNPRRLFISTPTEIYFSMRDRL